MRRYADLLADASLRVREIQPWDLRKQPARDHPPLVLDVREATEFALAQIPGWNDFDQPLVDSDGRPVQGDEAERRLVPKVRPNQRRPS